MAWFEGLYKSNELYKGLRWGSPSAKKEGVIYDDDACAVV